MPGKTAVMKVRTFLEEKQKKIWVIPVVMGIMLLVQTARHRQGPLRVEADTVEATATVRVAPARPAPEVPWVQGFGTVAPAKVWHAVADVPGRIVEIHPSLKEGTLVREGEILLRIDESGYRLVLLQQEASLAQARADLERLRIQERADRTSLKTGTRSLALYEKDLERYRNLLAEGAVSRAEVDGLERAALTERQKVQNLEKALSARPAERTALEARITGLEASVNRAALDLEHCLVRAPFDGRIASPAVELSQFVTGGKELLRIEDTSSLEINVQVGLDRITALGLEQEDQGPATALVRLQGATGQWFQWPARFDRDYHRVDPVTRTVGVVVTVDDILSEGDAVPLVSGMYCEVRLMGQSVPDLLAIPREALHGRKVYRVTTDNRLEYRQVTTMDCGVDDVFIRSGLEEGDLVVLSDMAAAIPGMKLNPLSEGDGTLAGESRKAPSASALEDRS